ncbi:hypothetical protein [Hymenobacter sp. PAMC 26628]|uniref:hypothetical protein n=1 Tax=Hymenobacter sp. PAMC 26628 TaxID=1484118 RepID=UPI000B2D579E|nr:hypothetical protein [Hymenobacter sp. PAMC 26628]
MKLIRLVLTIFFSLAFSISYGQRTRYIAHAALNGRPETDTLIDKINFTRFILDTTHVFITAFDINGKQLWKTDPWKDNGLKPYRVERPTIARFYFRNFSYENNVSGKRKNKRNKVEDEEIIWINYNNTQTGVIDKKTGKFSFLGQD